MVEPTGIPQRTEYATTEVEEAREMLTSLSGFDVRAVRRGGTSASIRGVSWDGLASYEVRMPFDYAYEKDNDDGVVVVNTMLGGSAEMRLGQTDHRFGVGDVYLVQPRTHVRGFSARPYAHAVMMPTSLLNELAADEGDRRWPRVPLSVGPTREGAQLWRAAARFVDNLLNQQYAATAPLVVGPAIRLLGATVLDGFGAATDTTPTSVDRHDAHSETLRRAVAFIEAHPDLDLSVGDIGRAACVTPRAVQLAFRRHLDTTPMAYLRQVRLDRAHHELLVADPGSTTIRTVAARWGFSSPAYFATAYRAMYGCRPSDTLRRRG
jgi:AraC-like DNA-binding protein